MIVNDLEMLNIVITQFSETFIMMSRTYVTMKLGSYEPF